MKNKKTLIIAEAGVNHNGSILLAKKLINIAAKSGADYVKFQTFKADNLALPNTKFASYQKKKSFKTKNQYELLKKLQLKKKDHLKLINYCKKKKIKFLSTAFDIDSLKFLQKLKLDFIKIPSGEITNFPYLVEIARLKKNTIVSTGMCTIKEIHFCLKTLIDHGLKKRQINLMHCNTSYPTPYQDANLNCITQLKRKFNTNIGYSDHTLGIITPVIAVSLGATIIEKHFTLDKNLPGPDHKASLEPKELKEMVNSIRNAEVLLGNGNKKVTPSEKKNIKVVRKSIVAKKNILYGERFDNKNLDTKRPFNGICASKWKKIIGRKSKRNYQKNQLIKF